MFYNNFVVSVKYNNNFLRDSGSIVNVPFGSEYSLYLKNLDSRKAVVKVSIDGKDVLDGSLIVIHPNSPLELTGFLKDNKVKNNFKFIQKTKEISEYRGDRIDDGIVRIEYTFEKKVNTVKVNYEYNNSYQYHYYPPYYITLPSKRDPFQYEWYCGDSDISFSSSGTHNCSIDNVASIKSEEPFIRNCSNTPTKDEGITVHGSESNQVFNIGGCTNELEETSNVITLNLRGFKDDGTKIVSTLSTKTKLTCNICGKKSNSDCSYCSRCGTYLI